MGKVNTEIHVGQSTENNDCSVLSSEGAICIATDKVSLGLYRKRYVVSRGRQGTRKGSEGEYYHNPLYTHRKLSKIKKGAKKNEH